MKTLIRNLTLCALILIPSLAMAEEVTVTVKGMVCSFCAQGIKKTFGKVDGVKAVDVDLEKKVVKLKVEEGRSLSDDQIKSTITDAGYDILIIERDKNA